MASRKIQAVLAQMQKNLECSICLEMMKNPVSTACGHQFCRFCIMEFLERKKQVPCPLCKKPVTKRGMKEREQLGQIVSNVHKLIEAYQADTGTLFSPPRGSSMNMLPSTPESIKAKPVKATTRRQSNVRGSNSDSAGRRISRENRKLNLEGKQSDKHIKQLTADDNDIPEHVEDSHIDLESDSCTIDSAVDNIQGTKDTNVQQLLDVIETGSHGAVEHLASSGIELKSTQQNLKSLQHKMAGPPFNLSHTNVNKGMVGEGCLHENDKEGIDMCEDVKPTIKHVETDNCMSDKNEDDCDKAKGYNINSMHSTREIKEVKQNGEKKTGEGLIQSGMSAGSQNSSENIVSLFQTPLGVKQINQKETKESMGSMLNTRSLRSKKNTGAVNKQNSHKDINNDSMLLTPDDNTGKELFDTKPENVKTYNRKGSLEKDDKYKRKVSDWLNNLPNGKPEPTVVSENVKDIATKANKKTVGKALSGVEQKAKVMGRRIKTFAGLVNNDYDGSSFGFDTLDKTTDVRKLSSEQNNELTNDKTVEMQETLDNVTTSKDDITTFINKPVQRKRIFKSKVTNSTTSDEREKKTESVESTDGHESKLMRVTNEECVEVPKETKAGGKTERLLKLSDSPMNGSPGNSDPYEFRSSQKTPQKQKNKATKPKKTKLSNKNKVVKITQKNKTEIKPTSIIKGNTKTEKLKKVNSIKVDTESDSNIDVTSSELKKIAAVINQAEDHDLMTCTQEVLMNMTDNEMKDTKQGPHQDESRMAKKQVRFREPTLSDFISPGKIDIVAYRKEKEVCEKVAEANNRMLHKVQQIETKDVPSLKGNIEDDLHRHETKENSHPEKQIKTKTLSKVNIKEKALVEEGLTHKPLSKEADENESDDMSVDFRFHDDSSGTDDLDINPDHCEFEQPDIEKQPQEIKVQLMQAEAASNSISNVKYESPDINSVKDTPQVLMGPRFKNSFVKPVKAHLPKIVNIVAETPLYVNQETELQAELNERATGSEDICENPMKASNIGIEDTTKNNDFSDCEDKDEDIHDEESAPLNFNIDTLEETDDIIPDSTALIDSVDANEMDKEHDKDTGDIYIATKVTDSETKACTDTDETQTPLCNFNLEEEDEAMIGEDEMHKCSEGVLQSNSCEKVEETLGSLSESQSSFSVLNLNHSKIKGEGLCEKQGDKNNGHKIIDSGQDIVLCSSESSASKVKKKKRKCFMLEDTQDIDETFASTSTSNENTSKRQKKMSQTVQRDLEDGNKESELFNPGAVNSKTEPTRKVQISDRDNHEANANQEEMVLISQNSLDFNSGCKKERQLSGILISPEENQDMSPEDIFLIDSEMPAVNFSPEEETQCDNSPSQLNAEVITDSLTQKTHVSDTQTSLSQGKTSSLTGSKRKSGVKASRGFSKKTRNSDEVKDSAVGTPGTPKTFNNSTLIRKSPEFTSKIRTTAAIKRSRDSDDENSVMMPETPKALNNSVSAPLSPGFPTRMTTDDNDQIQQEETTSPLVKKVLMTPRRQNILKYKSPVAGVKHLTGHPSPSVINTPSTSLSSAAIRKISKYSPGIHRTGASSRSPLSKDIPKNDAVEVFELDHGATNKENKNKSSSNQTMKKRSPVLKLQLTSQERSKMVEQVDRRHLADLEVDVSDDQTEYPPLPCLDSPEKLEVQENSCLYNSESIICDSVVKVQNKSNFYAEDDDNDVLEKQMDIESDTRLHQYKSDEQSNNSMSSDDLCLDDSDSMERGSTVSDTSMNDRSAYINTMQGNDNAGNNNSENQTIKMFTSYSHDLCLDDSDMEDDNNRAVLNVDKQTIKLNKCSSDIDENEAEVIEESDFDEEQPKKPEADSDDIRKVKRLRPKRAILSDSESDSEDESARLDCTSSSAFSSQSDNLTTQDREKLEKDLEKMAAEMAVLKNQLKHKKTKDSDTSHKDTVVVLDDDEEERIESDDSDVEMEHAPCLSPPPFSPVILSQERCYNEVISQDSMQETVNPEEDNTNLNDKKTEMSPVRKPLKDIDVNIIKDTQDKEMVKEKKLGFMATGLSSLQVMEIKKLASANDVVFYSKLNPSVSHVIVKADEDDNRMCDRTLKFFQGIAHKCWLVIYQWVLDSKEAGYLLPEGHYEIQGDTTMGLLHHGPNKSRLSEKDLFKDVKFSLFGDNKYLNKDSLVELIQACGGEIIDFNQVGKHGKDTLAICCTDLDDGESQEASHASTKCKELKKKFGVVTLKRDWIMDSLTTYTLQPVKLYTLS